MTERFQQDTVKVEGLERLMKALGGRPPVAKVGIMGGDSARTPKEGEKKAPTNVEIGAVHEFGSPARGIPQRSFLRVPISEGLKGRMEDSKSLDENTLKEVIRSGTVKPWLEEIAEMAKELSKESFDKQGPGWPKWKDPNYTNNTGMILQDTTQLRESITKEVK